MNLQPFRTSCRKTLWLVAVVLVSFFPCTALGLTDREQLLAQAEGFRSNDPEAALQLLDRALADLQPDRLVDEEIATVAQLLELRTTIQRGRAQYEAASADAQQLSRLAELAGDPGLAAKAAFLHGSIEAEQGQFAAALDRFHDARRRLKGANQPVELARIFNAIGVTHNFIGDHERAREYFQNAVDMAYAASDNEMAGTFLGNLALSVAQLDGPTAALPMLREVLRLGEASGAQTMVTMARANLCDQLVQLDKLQEAETTCLQALQEIDRMGETRWQAGIRLALGNLRKQNGRLENALNWYRQALTIAVESVPTIEDEVLDALVEVLAELGQASEALEISKRRIALRDQRRETERRELVEELEVRYEVERNEADLSLLRLKSELQATQIRQRNQLLIALLVILLVAVISAAGALRSYRIKAALERDLAQRNQDLEKALEHINELARHDSLTGLYNRRALEELGAREVNRQKRHGGPLSVMIMDVDYFKSINDRFGHAVGDQALNGLADVLRGNLRDSDLVGRWGGEEFLCILPDTDLDNAECTAQRIQSALEAGPIETSIEPIRLSLTYGIAAVNQRLDQAIQAADQALYRGKNDGRNTIVVAKPRATDNT